MNRNRTQIAFGRNFSLQRELEHKFLTIRRGFKYSRRRQDAFEEECVASLYKLLLYAKERQEERVDFQQQQSSPPQTPGLVTPFKTQPKAKRPYSVFEVRKAPDNSKEDHHRPGTSMSSILSAKSYRQSYSFTKDGMNIGRTRRERYLRNKAMQEKEKTNASVLIERLDAKGRYNMDNYLLSGDTNSKEEDDSPKQVSISQSATSRPPSVLTSHDRSQIPASPVRRESQMKPTTYNIHDDRHDASTSPRLLTRPHTSLSRVVPNTPKVSFEHTPEVNQLIPSRQATGSSQSVTASEHRRSPLSRTPTIPPTMAETPTRMTIAEKKLSVTGMMSPLSVKITGTKCETPDFQQPVTSTPRPDSAFFEVNEDELMPLSEDDLEHMKSLTTPDHTRPITRQGAKSAPTCTEEMTYETLTKSTEKTQVFLTEYSKKSKIFGYVVKTTGSNIGPRDNVRSFRSPSITYQELASIKANIKQHEARTKALLQRSGNLTKYVSKLANACSKRETRAEMLSKLESKNRPRKDSIKIFEHTI
ncbi:hypothetical protein DPMN_096263 [Dreissena polymorpha]|uniref:Uncharacterized protein n=1 Tax=Dreissena polymorpha TaxID=45954 RepID=A0A9D4L8V0_DREPO|nr:hypothetical protein DPMN_096263 [Dreissena polymorpha]